MVGLARVRQRLLARLAALAEFGALSPRLFVQHRLASFNRGKGALLFVFERGERSNPYAAPIFPGGLGVELD